MNKPNLSEKEFEIINVIADGFRSNQRELSNHIGLSLGMTNLLLKRLATKGFLRIKQLNRKKVEYLLTPRSIAEKAQKSYHYTLKTIESFSLIRTQIRTLLQAQMQPDVTRIVVAGEGDLADLVGMILRDLHSHGSCTVEQQALHPATWDDHTLIIDASADPAPHHGDSKNIIQIMHKLAATPQRRELASTERNVR